MRARSKEILEDTHATLARLRSIHARIGTDMSGGSKEFLDSLASIDHPKPRRDGSKALAYPERSTYTRDGWTLTFSGGYEFTSISIDEDDGNGKTFSLNTDKLRAMLAEIGIIEGVERDESKARAETENIIEAFNARRVETEKLRAMLVEMGIIVDTERARVCASEPWET